jgi:hypothetical protein
MVMENNYRSVEKEDECSKGKSKETNKEGGDLNEEEMHGKLMTCSLVDERGPQK